MTPEQVVVEREGRSRDRLMPRADAALLCPEPPPFFSRVLVEQMTAVGTVTLVELPDHYPGMIVVGQDRVIDRYMIRRIARRGAD